MPIFKALELVTAHMKSTDAALLDRYKVLQAADLSEDDLAGGLEPGRIRPPGGNLIVDPIGDYGWTIDLGVLQSKEDGEKADFVQALMEEGFSEEFVNALEYAAAMDVAAVRFDRDIADYEPGLPVFDWENDNAIEEPEPEFKI